MKAKKASSYILTFLLVVFILLLFLMKITKVSVYSMVSRSMEPELKVGNLIFNQKEAFTDIKKGDIITYKMKDTSIHVTHRVNEIDKEGKRILCKGDANRDVDDTFIDFETQYEGSLVFFIPYLGYAVTFLQSTLGKLMSVLIILFLLADIGYDFYKRKKQ